MPAMLLLVRNWSKMVHWLLPNNIDPFWKFYIYYYFLTLHYYRLHQISRLEAEV